MSFGFRVLQRDHATKARVGVLSTARGEIDTPAFMPVGTQATVKSLSPEELRQSGAQIVLANTYHLYLRPRSDLIERLGGLHSFMAWDGPILTDSGGFQVFSLGHLRTVDDDGVTFRSHIDGSQHVFTAESVVRIQEQLGSDIAMVLDECVGHTASRDQAKVAARRTTTWAERARRAKTGRGQVLFGIVQGGMFAELRAASAKELAGLDFPGYAIGGLSVGEPKSVFYEMLGVSLDDLPETKPRYAMGVGAPEDLFEAVGQGVDMFDCVLQTRLGRNGSLFTDEGRINIRNARFREDRGPIATGCDCYACSTFTLAYIHHLFRAEELLGYRLASLHNVRWTLGLMHRMREHIAAGDFAEFRREFLASYKTADETIRNEQRKRWQAKRGASPKPKAVSESDRS